MMPSCDQTGVPIHFHSSTTSGSASLMSLRILLRVSPRQSPSSAILFEMSSDADWPWLAPDFFMFSSWKFQRHFICKTVEDSGAPLRIREKFAIPAQHRGSKGFSGDLKRRRVMIAASDGTQPSLGHGMPALTHASNASTSSAFESGGVVRPAPGFQAQRAS